MANQVGNFTSPATSDYQKSLQAQQDVYAERQAREAQLRSQISPMPQMPQKQPGFDWKDHIGLFGAMFALSLLGGRKTGEPLTAAMNNLTASIKGVKEGNDAAAKSNEQEMWRNFNAALEEHRQQLEEYRLDLGEMMRNPEYGPNAVYLKLVGKYHMNPNVARMYADPKTGAALLAAGQKAQMHAEEMAQRLQLFNQAQDARREQVRLANISRIKMQYEKEREALLLKKAAATTDSARKSYQEEIDALGVRERIDLLPPPSAAPASPAAPAPQKPAEKPVPTDADREYVRQHPEARAQFIAHFGVEP